MKRLREDILNLSNVKSRRTKKGNLVKDLNIDYLSLDIRDMEKNSSFEVFLLNEISYLIGIKIEDISIAISVTNVTNIKITIKG